MKIAKYVIPYTIVLLLVIGIVSCSKSRKDYKREKQNTEALTKQIEKYKLSDSTSVATIASLTLKKNEMEELYSNKVKECERLNISLKRVKSYSSAATQTTITLRDTIRDSIIMVENYLDTIKCVNYHDNWTDFTGCIDKDNVFSGEIVNRDTITQVVHYTYDHYFLWFRWGKRLKTTMHSSNPYTDIIYEENIQIEK